MVSTPQYECCVVSCDVELPNVYLNCLGDLSCDRCNKKHFEVLNLICHVSCHLDRMLRSDCSCRKSGVLLIEVYMTRVVPYRRALPNRCTNPFLSSDTMRKNIAFQE